MEDLKTALALLCAVATLGAVSKRVRLPLPILQVAGGALLSLAPGFSNIHVKPEVFFALFIPPLLFSDGWFIPKREFARAMRPVLLLALGLVTLTVVVVGYLIHAIIPTIPLAAGFALGAVISPTDAVAVSAVTKRLSLHPRVTNVVNGESLVNDASGLLAFKFAVAAVSTGVFSAKVAAVNFFALSIGGILIGLAVAWVIGMVRVWLVRGDISEPSIQTTLSLLTPFAAYFPAVQMHVSGILAVVAAGIYAGIHDTRNLTTADRLQTSEVWTVILFAFNGMAFILLGLQLPNVIAGIKGHQWNELAAYALILSTCVILLRLAWVYPGAYIPRWMFRSIREQEAKPTPGQIFIVGWSGIRGSVNLAAALSLPLTTAMGEAFPERNLLIFLAGSVIVVTLLVHGLTLPPLIRWFGVAGDGAAEREEQMARIAVARAAINRIKQHVIPESDPHEQAFAGQLIAWYERKIEHLETDESDREDIDTQLKVERNLRLNAISAEREELLRMHADRSINEETLRIIQREIDHLESALLPLTRVV